MKRAAAALALALAVWAPSTLAMRIAVVAGSNEGAGADEMLSFAEKDAEQVADALVGVGGFHAAETILLRAPSAVGLRRAIVAANERLRAQGAVPDADSVLVVYYSGHADENGLRIAGTRLELEELSQLIRSSPARFRILIVDACRSGALTHVKGGTAAPPIDVRASGQIDAEGFVMLTAAAAGEAAQESVALGGSFFTHHLVSGLLGAADADADDTVTLSEAYRYAYENTRRDSSAGLSGTQHPTYRYEIRGRGDLPLSRLRVDAESRGRVTFPSSFDFLVLAGGERGAAVAEVRANGAHTISLRPGRYFVRGRGQRVLLEGEIEVTRGQALTVDARALRRVEYARLARKGTGDLDMAQGPALFVWGRSGLTAPEHPCAGAGASYELAFRYLTLAPRVSWCVESSQNDIVSATTHELSADLRASYTFDIVGGLGVVVGTSVGAAYLRQDFATRGVAPPSNTGAGLIAPFLGLEGELPIGFSWSAAFEARTYVVSVAGRAGPAEVATPLTAAWAVAIVKYF